MASRFLEQKNQVFDWDISGKAKDGIWATGGINQQEMMDQKALCRNRLTESERIHPTSAKVVDL